MEEYEIARMWRDARVQRIYGGTTEIMKEIVGRSLGLVGGVWMQRVVVVGGGIMGNGIAQVVATSGLHVTLVDVSSSALEKAKARIEKSFARAVKGSKLAQEEADAAFGRLSFVTDIGVVADAGPRNQTVVEDLEVKREVLSGLDRLCPRT